LNSRSKGPELAQSVGYNGWPWAGLVDIFDPVQTRILEALPVHVTEFRTLSNLRICIYKIFGTNFHIYRAFSGKPVGEGLMRTQVSRFSRPTPDEGELKTSRPALKPSHLLFDASS